MSMLLLGAGSAGFLEGFETGNLSRWDATTVAGGGSLTVQAGSARTGGFGLRVIDDAVAGSQANARKNFSTRNTAYAEGWFRWTGDSGGSGSNGTGLRLFAAGTRLVDTFRQDLTGSISVRYVDSAAAQQFLAAGVAASLNTWTKLALFVDRPGAGAVSTIKLWVNDVLRVDSTGLDIQAGNFDNFRVGSEHPQVVQLDIDDVRIAL
jgi:hypothetical protein